MKLVLTFIIVLGATVSGTDRVVVFSLDNSLPCSLVVVVSPPPPPVTDIPALTPPNSAEVSTSNEAVASTCQDFVSPCDADHDCEYPSVVDCSKVIDCSVVQSSLQKDVVVTLPP